MYSSFLTPPLLLTYSRILLAITLIVLNFLIEDIFDYKYLLLGVIFILASLTDWLDGYLARKLKLESHLGAVLDPISDKILSASAILILISENIAPILPCAIILFREIFISGLRESLSNKNYPTLKVTLLAKLKTFIQFISFTLLLLGKDIEKIFIVNVINIGVYALWIAAILTVWTGSIYFYRTLGYLN